MEVFRGPKILKLIIIGQISVYFGLLILSLRHFFIFPAHQYETLVGLMLIGFAPSLLARYLPVKFASYILVMNALLIVCVIFSLLQEWALAGVFVLVPVFSLLFQSRVVYLFASLCSFVLSITLSYLYLFDAEVSAVQLVILLDVTTVFLVLVFIIHFVVKDLRWKAVTEAKHLQTILALSQSVEAKDPYTRGHSVRVADLAAWIAQRIPQLDEQTVHRCGLIHDVGKLAIPDTILLKNSRLTDEEYEIMKSHTLEGAKLCENLDIPTEIILGVKHHHERWDGLGYPLGLQGENISLIGRVLCVADAIDAMCSDRAYRHALDMRAVQEQLRTGANKQFDPVLIKLVLAGWKDFEKYYGTHA